MFTTQLSLLGRVQIRRHNQPAELTIAKMQALLAYLAVTGAPLTRSRALDLLWTESHSDAARKNLRNNLWRVRQTLGDDVLVTDDDLIMLSGSVWTDVSAFESGLAAHLSTTPGTVDELQTVIELWRGPLLEGLNLTEAPDFDLWLSSERERLGQLYLRGLNQLLSLHRANSQWQEMMAVAHRSLAHDNTQESMHVALMEAHANLGERTEALRQYDTLRTILQRELGVAPLSETQRLRTKIMQGESTGPITSVDSAMPRHPATTAIAPKKRRESVGLFVGRQHECDRLYEALRTAIDGPLQIVLLTGELGIGKSTLWQQWSAGLSPETVVLQTRCLDTTQSLPFAPLTGLFGSQICLRNISGPQSPISPVWLTELARLFPEIRDVRPELPAATPLPAPEERRRIFEAFVQVLRALATTPLILFVDDLHWADQATLDWLVYLTGRMSDEPLLLVVAYRANEGSPELMQHVAAWNRTDVAHLLPLSRLSIQETTELITALDGNMDMVDHLYTQSGGNPYYLTELTCVYPDGAPAALVDLVSARIRSLPEGVQRLIQVATILEPTITFDMLHRIGGKSEDETLDEVDVLLDAAILTERGSEYEFAHPLIASIVRNSLSDARRRNLHKRIAEQMKADHADSLEAIAGQLTGHYAAAGEQIEAACHADMAAEHAFQMAAMSEAVAFYRQALAFEPTPTRRLALGYALLHVPGGLQAAREAMQQALDEFESRQDASGIAQAGLRLAVSYLSTEEGEKVLDWAERISTDLAAIENVELRATLQYLMAQGKFYTVHAMRESTCHFREATRLATEHELNSDIALQSWFGWGNLSVQCGEFAQAQAKFKRALEAAQSSGNIYFEALSYNNMAYAALLAGDVATARATIDTGLDFVNRHELMRPRQYLYSTRGEVALAEAELDEAERWFKRGIEEAERYENAMHVLNIRAHLGRVARARGDLKHAEQLLVAARHAIPASSAKHLQIQMDLWLAEVYLMTEDYAAAQSTLDVANEQLTGSERQALQAQANRLAEQLSITENEQIY